MLARGTSAASEGQCMKRRLAIMKAARGNVELTFKVRRERMLWVNALLFQMGGGVPGAPDPPTRWL